MDIARCRTLPEATMGARTLSILLSIVRLPVVDLFRRVVITSKPDST